MAETRDELRSEYDENESDQNPGTTPPAHRTAGSTLVMGDQDDPTVIRAQINQTRAQMSETVDMLHARLSPENLKQQAQDAIREATVGKVKDMAQNVEHTVKSWRSNLASAIKQNPVPAAMVAIGLGWLFMAHDNDEANYDYWRSPYRGTSGYDREWDYRAGEYDRGREEGGMSSVREGISNIRETVSEKVDEVKSNLQETADQARERVDHMKEQAQQRAEELSQQARYEAYRVKQGFRQMMVENPLAVGAAALAIGATIGLILPATQRENQWMGEARDRFVDKAQATAQQTMETVREAVQEDIEEITQTTTTGTEKNRTQMNPGSNIGREQGTTTQQPGANR